MARSPEFTGCLPGSQTGSGTLCSSLPPIYSSSAASSLIRGVVACSTCNKSSLPRRICPAAATIIETPAFATRRAQMWSSSLVAGRPQTWSSSASLSRNGACSPPLIQPGAPAAAVSTATTCILLVDGTARGTLRRSSGSTCPPYGRVTRTTGSGKCSSASRGKAIASAPRSSR